MLATVVLVAAFGALTAAGSAAAPAPADVNAADFSFSPQSITVDPGATVTWHISGGPHTITADGGAFDSGSRPDGSVFQFTFGQPGSYAYSCQFHKSSGMTGVVEVRSPVSTTTTTGPPTTTTTRPHTTTTRPSTTTTRPPTTTTTVPDTTTSTWPATPTTARPSGKKDALTPPADTTPSTGERAGKNHPTTSSTDRQGRAHNSTTTSPATPLTSLPPLPVFGEDSPAPAPVPPAPAAPGPQVQLVAPAAARPPDHSSSKLPALMVGFGAIALVGLGTGIWAWRNRSSRYWSA